jgi:hypothetical protein
VRRPISPRIRIAWLAPVRGKPRHDQEPRAEKYRAVQIHQREWVSLVEAVLRPQRGRQGHRPSPSHLNGHRSRHAANQYIRISIGSRRSSRSRRLRLRRTP